MKFTSISFLIYQNNLAKILGQEYANFQFYILGNFQRENVQGKGFKITFHRGINYHSVCNCSLISTLLLLLIHQLSHVFSFVLLNHFTNQMQNNHFCSVLSLYFNESNKLLVTKRSPQTCQEAKHPTIYVIMHMPTKSRFQTYYYLQFHIHILTGITNKAHRVQIHILPN